MSFTKQGKLLGHYVVRFHGTDHTAELRLCARCTEQSVPSSQQYETYPVVHVPRTLPQHEGTAQIAEAWSSFLSEMKSESRDQRDFCFSLQRRTAAAMACSDLKRHTLLPDQLQ